MVLKINFYKISAPLAHQYSKPECNMYIYTRPPDIHTWIHFLPPSNSKLSNVVAQLNNSLLKLPNNSTSKLKRFNVVKFSYSSGNAFKNVNYLR